MVAMVLETISVLVCAAERRKDARRQARARAKELHPWASRVDVLAVRLNDPYWDVEMALDEAPRGEVADDRILG
jgi:hypothetical protein